MSNELEQAKLDGAKTILNFVMGGNSTFTVRSVRTGTRYTFKICKPNFANEKTSLRNPEMFLVKVLIGQDNENDYLLFGKIVNNVFTLTQKAKVAGITYQTGYVVAIMWVLQNLFAGVEPKNTEIWHAGRCGRCGRKLTVPESILLGMGSDCASKG